MTVRSVDPMISSHVRLPPACVGISLPWRRFDESLCPAVSISTMTRGASGECRRTFADVRALRRHRKRSDHASRALFSRSRGGAGSRIFPKMLFAAMGCKAAGVMIARGHLAAQRGFERMAEVPEKMLWACEAAHLPVVWATWTLESLAKDKMPSCVEITDAAMEVRAECVMPSMGAYIPDALRTLEDSLRPMQSHRPKRRSLLRARKAWSPPKQQCQAKGKRRWPGSVAAPGGKYDLVRQSGMRRAIDRPRAPRYARVCTIDGAARQTHGRIKRILDQRDRTSPCGGARLHALCCPPAAWSPSRTAGGCEGESPRCWPGTGEQGSPKRRSL